MITLHIIRCAKRGAVALKSEWISLGSKEALRCVLVATLLRQGGVETEERHGEEAINGNFDDYSDHLYAAR